LDKNGQRQFLTFATGTSRLPIGGFKALSPKLTIVKKAFDKTEIDFPDNYLPTVMTCQNTLKLPEYSSYEILEKKMMLAMKEGSQEFSLS
jgi:E3 ubiquitin-protein ligase TRIP12